MSRPVNFSAGPSMIPMDVLESLAAEMVDYQKTGLSLVEVSHRGAIYGKVHRDTIVLIRELMSVPEDYSILLLGGGATLQFSMLPMNLLPPGESADYIDSGAWAHKAIEEARKEGAVNVIYNGAVENYMNLPDPKSIKPSPGAAYLHITSNETIGGVQWKTFPESRGVPMVVDMSSDILSRAIDVGKFGLIYAGAQKNLGPAGVSIVIVRNELLDRSPKNLGSYLSYAIHAKADSLYNTPPVFPIWGMKLVLEGVKRQGGVDAVARRNTRKAAKLYEAIDTSGGFYHCPVNKNARSDMNVVWRLRNEALEVQFIEDAANAGLIGLKGHRSVGGCRASIYNALTVENVGRLIEFMTDFSAKNR